MIEIETSWFDPASGKMLLALGVIIFVIAIVTVWYKGNH